MIPVGPTRGDKDGSWRGGSFLVGGWTILLVLGLFTPMPTFVLSDGFWGSFLWTWFGIGAVMSIPYALAWNKLQAKPDLKKKSYAIYEARDDSGVVHAVYHPDGPSGSSPPLNKGISRSLDARWTIWREFTWVAPVTFGDIVLTAVWNLLFRVLHGRRPSRGVTRAGFPANPEDF